MNRPSAPPPAPAELPVFPPSPGFPAAASAAGWEPPELQLAIPNESRAKPIVPTSASDTRRPAIEDRVCRWTGMSSFPQIRSGDSFCAAVQGRDDKKMGLEIAPPDGYSWPPLRYGQWASPLCAQHLFFTPLHYAIPNTRSTIFASVDGRSLSKQPGRRAAIPRLIPA